MQSPRQLKLTRHPKGWLVIGLHPSARVERRREQTDMEKQHLYVVNSMLQVTLNVRGRLGFLGFAKPLA